MQIPLDLTSHCIQTEIKRLYEQALRRYFKPDAGTAALEETIELLKSALERFDFSRLRTRYPALCGGRTGARVVLYSDGEGQIEIRIDGVVVDAGKWKEE